MIKTDLTTLAHVLNAQLIGENTDISAVSTDTRKLDQGSLFVALVGARFDAHDFYDVAQQSGASALVVSRKVSASIPQLLVADTRIALGQLGAWVKQQSQVKTVAITGSCGKTTVKEMLASILSRKGNTLATSGNFNNDIGVPLTLLRLTPEYDFAVIELGANHIGEIAYTTALTQPDVAMVTNLAAAHLEGFGSMEGVAKAKGEIFQGLQPGSVALINQDSNGQSLWQDVLADKKCRYISTSGTETLSVNNLYANEDGCWSFDLEVDSKQGHIRLPVPGEHNISNALMAATAALSFAEISMDDVVAGLAEMKSVKGRTCITYPRQGLRLIDDTYNASVPAMKAAIDLLASYPEHTLLVLGDMAEMGSHSATMHAEVADHAKQATITQVFTTGPASAAISDACGGQHFEEKSALIQRVVEEMKKNQNITILVKGARGMAMEEVVAAIEESAS